MNTSQWAQVLAIIRLEIWKTFFSRRGLWIYLFALAPVLLFTANSVYAPREQARLARIAETHQVALTNLVAITRGMSNSVVLEQLGEPYQRRNWNHPVEGGRVNERGFYRYTDGRSDFTFHFNNGRVREIERSDPETVPQQLLIFATIFRFYFLRLAVFFGCVGIFTNLFRGEMLDKSLHFYLLTPARREILLAGKYLAGLLATIVIFTASATLQWMAMLWQFNHDEVAGYFSDPTAAHLLPYLGVTVLACATYGSVFLCAGLLFRNPIVPATIILLWESANLFLPAALQKMGLIYYLQSLCPLAAAPDNSMPVPLTLLISSTPSASVPMALVVLILFTLAVLVYSGVRSKRLEINYSTD
jgi:ABC-type transport system involved in multi-copper enzyme maturation permease subunit